MSRQHSKIILLHIQLVAMTLDVCTLNNELILNDDSHF